MPNLFGLDIASLVNKSLKSAGGVRPGTLVRSVPGTRTTGALGGGVQPVETSFRFSGFVETKQDRRPDSTVPVSYPRVSILGASLSPATEPAVNDVASVDGRSYRLLELLEADPAGALYVFKAEAV